MTHAIKINEDNLSRIEIAHSSVFSLPVRRVPVLPNGDNSDFESKNNSNLGQALENKFKAAGDKLAETFECTFGFACASDLDKAAKNPNLGKNLSSSDKVELGGTSSGAPDGWGPEDEVNSRVQNFSTEKTHLNPNVMPIEEGIGILRDAARGYKGNFNLGQATSENANILGEAWVGHGFRISRDGTSWVSSDGLRIYRPPSLKPNSQYSTTGVQANFEQKLTPTGRPISNGHLDIIK
ncbi:TPA: hypothetical protein ACKROV_000458 [Providencia alcalifaciens]